MLTPNLFQNYKTYVSPCALVEISSSLCVTTATPLTSCSFDIRFEVAVLSVESGSHLEHLVLIVLPELKLQR